MITNINSRQSALSSQYNKPPGDLTCSGVDRNLSRLQADEKYIYISFVNIVIAKTT